jgi:hypothetical protein
MFKLKPKLKHSRRDSNENVELRPIQPEISRGRAGSDEIITSNVALQRFDVRNLSERLRTNSVMTAMELLALEYEDQSDNEECMVNDQTDRRQGIGMMSRNSKDHMRQTIS